MNLIPTKICLSIDWYLPGTRSGGPVRSVANLVAALPDIHFYILTRNTDYCSEEPYEGIAPNTWVQQGANVWVYYFSQSGLTKAAMRKQVMWVNPDVLYVSGMYSRCFSQWPVFIGKEAGIKTVVAARGMLSPHALAVKPLKKWIFLRLMVWLQVYRPVRFHATSSQEAQDILRMLGPTTSVQVVSNVGRPLTTQLQPIAKEKGQVRLVSIGRIAPEKGTWVGLNALSKLQGEAVLDLYGTAYDAGYWQSCEALMAQLPKAVQVHYHGPCDTHEVPQKLAMAHALLLPSEGENYGHAIVESLAEGRPVIISKHTPWQQLSDHCAGWDVSADDLPQTLQRLLDLGQTEYNQWMDGAKRYHQTHIQGSQDAVIEAYRELFQRDEMAENAL